MKNPKEILLITRIEFFRESRWNQEGRYKESGGESA